MWSREKSESQTQSGAASPLLRFLFLLIWREGCCFCPLISLIRFESKFIIWNQIITLSIWTGLNRKSHSGAISEEWGSINWEIVAGIVIISHLLLNIRSSIMNIMNFFTHLLNGLKGIPRSSLLCLLWCNRWPKYHHRQLHQDQRQRHWFPDTWVQWLKCSKCKSIPMDRYNQ